MQLPTNATQPVNVHSPKTGKEEVELKSAPPLVSAALSRNVQRSKSGSLACAM